MTIELLIEIVVVALLTATCGYCIVLYRKLRALQRSQGEMARLMRAFDDASRRAERNLAAMQEEGVTTKRDLAIVAGRARALIDELGVMVHAGERVADRIESLANDARAVRALIDESASRAA